MGPAVDLLVIFAAPPLLYLLISVNCLQRLQSRARLGPYASAGPDNTDASGVSQSRPACHVPDRLPSGPHLSRYGVGVQQQRLQGAAVLEDGRRHCLEAIAGRVNCLQTLQAAQLSWQALHRIAYLKC